MVAQKSGAKKFTPGKIILRITLSLILIGVSVYIAFQVSPWPSVFLIRYGFGSEGTSMNEALAKYVPKEISRQSDIAYDSSDNNLTLDVYFEHNHTATHPLIVWVHGGGFVAGDKKELANYCKIVASKKFVVAAINYTVAPEAHYPVPVHQLNTAIAFLMNHAARFKIDTTNIFLAGDSGGAHIVAQLANAFTSQEYASLLKIKPSVKAKKLKGVILHCGPYNTDLVDFDGPYGKFLNTVLWSYIGRKDFFNDPAFDHFSVSKFVTQKFPPTFLSVGNQDPLREHSYDLSARLSSKGVQIDTLFFADDFTPGLPHEYQFNLDTPPGKVALERMTNFVAKFSENRNP